jgi:hypothetical protein
MAQIETRKIHPRTAALSAQPHSKLVNNPEWVVQAVLRSFVDIQSADRQNVDKQIVEITY